MDQFLNKIPKATLLILVLFLGIMFIVLSDPPKTVCHAQEEIFREEIKSFLLADKKKKIKTPKYDILINQCKIANSPGGCYELFNQMRRLRSNITQIPQSCRAELAQFKPVYKALWEVLELMVRLGWGSHPPVSYYDKLNWLDSADLNLFCQLKDLLIFIDGKEKWERFREKMFTSLPGAETLAREEVWKRMVLSVQCSQYL